MRRFLITIACGLVGAILAYYTFYQTGTARLRSMLRSEHPELAWLKAEFKLPDAEFARVAELHAGYLPRCSERCRQIEQLNESLAQQLNGSQEFTPEMARLLQERSQLFSLCQTEMLKHFFEVSRTMPPAQGKRYLEWVSTHTHLRQPPMSHEGMRTNELHPDDQGVHP
jgi:hypothetical protein